MITPTRAAAFGTNEANDWKSSTANRTSAEFASDTIDAFDELLEQSTRGGPLVFGLALHPYIVGQPHRLRQLRRALEHIQRRAEESGAVWFTQPGEVARHAATVLP